MIGGSLVAATGILRFVDRRKTSYQARTILERAMRPCNQCRQPIENRRLICEQCEQKNLDEGNPYRASVGLHTGENDLPDEEEDIVDHSFNILLLTFDAIIAALGAMLGLASYGWAGFFVGGAAGLLVGLFLFLTMTR
jgi:hypothetical protein